MVTNPSFPAATGHPSFPAATGVGRARLAITPDGRRVYVTNLPTQTSELPKAVNVIDTVTNKLVASITGSQFGAGTAGATHTGSPFDVAITPDGLRAYVTMLGTNAVFVIDTTTNTATEPRINPGAVINSGVAITPNGRHAYVTFPVFASGVGIIDTSTNKFVSPTIGMGPDLPTGVVITPDGRHAYVTGCSMAASTTAQGSVSVIDTGTKRVDVSNITVGHSPIDIAITPDGGHVYVTNRDSDSVSVIDTTTNTVIGPPISVGNKPSGVAITPDGRHAYISNQLSSSLSIIDTAAKKVIEDITVGDGPSGVAITPDGRHVYVAIRGADMVSVLQVLPVVSGLNPNTGPTTGGTPVVITGTNLNGATVVNFGPNQLTGFTLDPSGRQLRTNLPAGVTGSVQVTVTTPGGTSNPLTYTYT